MFTQYLHIFKTIIFYATVFHDEVIRIPTVIITQETLTANIICILTE